MRISHLLTAAALTSAAFGGTGAQGLDLTVNDVGIAIGNKPRVTGLRFNFRDRGLEKVKGLNATIWMPYEPISGRVEGIALGVPVTGAANINGIGVALFGFGASESITGLGVAPLGFGAGTTVKGLMLAGGGFGAGGSFTGIGVAGLGAGIGSSMNGILIAGLGTGVGSEATGLIVGGLGAGIGSEFRGIAVGGVGVGIGNSSRGVAIGGIGIGAGNDFRGIGIGGVGIGAGGDASGIMFGGVGVGVGRRMTGLAIGGVGIGAGETIHGVAIAGLGIGAPRIEGITASLAAGAHSARAIVIAPAYFKIVGEDGDFRGGSLSAWNRIQGTQRGLTIGLLNTARELHGVQIGLINVSENGGKRLVLPVIAARH